MRPIPAPRIGDSHGLLHAVGERERVRLDEFLTADNVEGLFPAGLENALGRMRQYLSYARAAGLLREDRGVVELTEIGKRYSRAGDPERTWDVSPAQAEWLRRQLLDKHMTDSIFHGLAIGMSLLSSVTPGTRISALDFGRALGYLGRAGWDNENTLQIQGERYLVLLRDMELIDDERALTPTGTQTKSELTLPVHMSLFDIAAQLNPGGPDAVRAEGEAEWAAQQDGGEAAPEPEPEPEPEAPVAAEPVAEAVPAPAPAAPEPEEDEYEDVGPGAWAAIEEEPVAVAPAAPAVPEPVAAAPAASPPPPPPSAPAPAPAPAREDAATVIAGARTDAPPPPTPAAPTPAAPLPTVGAFLEAAHIRAAAEKRGLRLPAAVYANAAAALTAGRHVLLTGAPAAGKTTLALAVAEAAAAAGRAAGAVLVTASRGWAEQGVVLDSAARSRWLVVDDLDRANLDRALGPLSSFLAGLPVTLAETGETRAPDDWRLVATASRVPTRASAALLDRFAVVDVAAPPDAELIAALDAAANQDQVAAGAARRLLGLRDVRPLGAGVFLAAARHGAARRAVEPIGESALARELHAAYVQPLLGDLDADGAQRVQAMLDAL